jgi:hypothetical protein
MNEWLFVCEVWLHVISETLNDCLNATAAAPAAVAAEHCGYSLCFRPSCVAHAAADDCS